MRTDQLRRLPLLIRAAAARAGLFGIPVVLCWDLGGESPLHPREAHMYSWFMDLYFPCTGYNLYKTLPIFMQTQGSVATVGKILTRFIRG